MRHAVLPLTLFFAASCCSVFAQHAASPSQRYFRLICLVHLTGSGKNGDPVRPEYAPASSAAAAADRHGIIAWSSQVSDDGQMAIVEYVAVDRAAFQAILADTRPEVRVFELGKTPPEAIESALGVFKSGFTLASFEVFAQ